MPICANAAADMTSTTSANNVERMGEILCIVIPLARSSFACPVSLCGCGLRGLKGTISGRHVLATLVRKCICRETFSFWKCRSLCKSAHFQRASLAQRAFCLGYTFVIHRFAMNDIMKAYDTFRNAARKGALR